MLQIDKEKLNTNRVDDIDELYAIVDIVNTYDNFKDFQDVYQYAIDVLVDLVDDKELTPIDAFNILACLNDYQRCNR